MIDLLIDLYQQRRIGEAAEVAEDARTAARRVRDDLQDLKRKTDALTIVCHSLWELLQQQTGLSDDMLLRKMEEIDLRDGRKDGRLQPAPAGCPGCGRKNDGRRRACLYCGAVLGPTGGIPGM